jgi:Antirestriction protein
MHSEPQGAQFDNNAPDELQRHAAPIARHELQRDDWCDQIGKLVPQDWRYSFEDDLLRTWVWLCPNAHRPVAWTTWILSNGAVYAAPKGLGTINVRTPVLGVLEAAAADTSGLIATILAVSWRLSMFPEGAGGRKLGVLMSSLLAFGRTHPEALAISAAID